MNTRHLGVIGLAVALVVALAAVVSAQPAGTTTTAAASSVSPLIWGENLRLERGSLGSEPFLASPAFRNGLRNAHTTIIRMPVRGETPDSAAIVNLPELEQAATYVKELGMTPLVILRNPESPNLLENDLQIVRLMNGIFTRPDEVVYYEWGNETDMPYDPANQVDVESYAATWNQVVPPLKAAATHTARFVGPVTYQYNRPYLETFLRTANPAPDAVSWHEYTCASEEPQAACLADIDRWTAHFTDARELMTAVGRQLPIWITEWNFNPNINNGNDPDAGDQEFLHAWVTKALQNLAHNQIAGSMHYDVDNRVPLVDSQGNPAAQGRAFTEQYEALVTGAPTAPSTTTTPPSTTSSSRVPSTSSAPPATSKSSTSTTASTSQQPAPTSHSSSDPPANNPVVFTATAGEGCPDNDTRGIWMSTGWTRHNTGGDAGQGCDGSYRSSAEGDSAFVWWFQHIPATTGCTIRVFVPPGHTGPARYSVLSGPKAGDEIAHFTLDHTGHHGTWVTAGAYRPTTGRLSVRLSGQAAAAALSISCAA